MTSGGVRLAEELTYEEFIQNILDARGRCACGAQYHERHHIVPKSVGGGNEEENLIDLYAREHFIAHKLLASENPENEKLVYAYTCMAFVKSEDQNRYELSPEEYEEARDVLSKSKTGKPRSEETRNKLSEHMKKQWGNPEWRKNMLEKIEPTYSSQERNEKLSIKAKERFQNSENHPMYGKHMSEESKRKNSESHKGKKPSNETRMKLSESRIGSKNPNYGKTISDEQREKISKSKKR